MKYMQSSFVRNNDVSWKILEENCILLHLASGYYYTLNKVGKFLWESLAPEKTLAEICESVTGHYDIDLQTVQNDIEEIVEDLLREGLVEKI